LSINVKVPTFADKAPQVATVMVDGKEAGKVSMPTNWKWTKYSVTIEPDNNRPAVSTVEFNFSQNLAEGDKRPLALLVESITIE